MTTTTWNEIAETCVRPLTAFNIPGTIAAAVTLDGATEAVEVFEFARHDTPEDSPYDMIPPRLALLSRRAGDEYWMTWNPLSEYAAGDGRLSAAHNLWRQFCTYLESLVADEDRLADPLKRDLDKLREIMRKRE